MTHSRALTVALVVMVGCGQDDRPPPMSDMTLGGERVQGQVLESGRVLYNRYCASCHAIDGSGEGPAAGQLAHRPRDFRQAQFVHCDAEDGALPSHTNLVNAIRNGIPDQGMPPWNGLRQDDLDALAHYIKTFSPRWAEAGAA